LNEVTQKSSRRWKVKWGCQSSCPDYLASTSERYVYAGRRPLHKTQKDLEKGEECVRKVFKTGSVFKQSAFDRTYEWGFL
jgi:hypothetical protein